jgi:hypothetical protein
MLGMSTLADHTILKLTTGNSRLSGGGLTGLGINHGSFSPLTMMLDVWQRIRGRLMNGASYSMTAACSFGGVTSGKCVLSNKLMLCRLHSNIKKRAQLRNEKH